MLHTLEHVCVCCALLASYATQAASFTRTSSVDAAICCLKCSEAQCPRLRLSTLLCCMGTSAPAKANQLERLQVWQYSLCCLVSCADRKPRSVPICFTSSLSVPLPELHMCCHSFATRQRTTSNLQHCILWRLTARAAQIQTLTADAYSLQQMQRQIQTLSTLR